ncbi:hypothetical protein N6H14_17890 [Paenibacillus sp. CC-CFT747]|nr:hypothetical protein N6H14_17890 [Paenibacillus sp. CC-CFT747]
MGDSFSLPDLTTALEFKADGLDEQITPQGNTTVVRLLVTNKSKEKRSIPDFRLNALSDKAYTGQRLEQGNVTLEPGEQRYVHFTFPIENRLDLHSLMVLTPETFTADDKTTVTYYVGRLAVTLPEDSNAQPFIRKPVAYDWNSRIPFDSLNRLIHPKLEVALADLHLNESEGGGFKSGIAKFKLINRSDRPLPLPNFQTQWVSADGSKYAGTRQSTKVDSLMPNVGYVLYYSFVLPASEKGDRVGMELLDGVTAAPYKATIASLQTGIKPSVKGLDFYPFQVKLNDWTVTPEQAQPQATTFTYKVNLDLSVTRQDEVVVDQTFTRMKVELLDSQGNTLGAKLLPLTGEGRVESGIQTIDIRSIRSVRDFSLRVYETVETPFGEAERLLGTFAP